MAVSSIFVSFEDTKKERGTGRGYHGIVPFYRRSGLWMPLRSKMKLKIEETKHSKVAVAVGDTTAVVIYMN